MRTCAKCNQAEAPHKHPASFITFNGRPCDHHLHQHHASDHFMTGMDMEREAVSLSFQLVVTVFHCVWKVTAPLP